MIKSIKRILIILIMIILLLTVSSSAFTIEMLTDKNEVKVGEEVVYTINSDENVVAANFDINYNSSSVELIGSSTDGLDVANKNGKIACIYADIDGIGTNSFQIRFRAKETPGSVSFSISDAKFGGVNQEASYANEDITGLNIQTNINIIQNKNNITDNTTSKTRLPQAGVNNLILVVIVAIAIIVAIIFKFKLNKMKKILPMIIGIVMLGGFIYNTQAVTNNSLSINFSEINGNSIAKVMLSKSRSVTKNELIQANGNITSIKDENQNEIENTARVRTGYTLQTANGTSNIAILGDANKDGYICDTDDLMVIINTHLGKITPDELTKISANLDDKNDVLDNQDIEEMKNIFLGRTNGNESNGNGNESNKNLAKDVLKIDSTATDAASKSPYVKYNGLDCRVLYNDETHGLQIITAESVENVTLGYEDTMVTADDFTYNGTATVDDRFKKAAASYNNAVDNLNKKARTYMDEKGIATDARCLGSISTLNSSSKFQGDTSEMWSGTDPYLETYSWNNKFKDEDTNYNKEYYQLKDLGLHASSEEVWLASRNMTYNSDTATYYYFMRSVKSNGGLVITSMFSVYSNGTANYGLTKSYGFRPVFLLSSNVTIISGDGSSESPYVIE